MFFHESLELLPYLANLGLILLPLGALLGRPLLGLDQRLLKGRHLRRGLTIATMILSFFAIALFYIYLKQGISYLPSPRAAAWLGRALARTARGSASAYPPPQLVRQRPAAKPTYAY